ncbi:MAG: hypothetical protein Q7S12_03755 [bacterium]|nr:hypothetical protein [bacterium]
MTFIHMSRSKITAVYAGWLLSSLVKFGRSLIALLLLLPLQLLIWTLLSLLQLLIRALILPRIIPALLQLLIIVLLMPRLPLLLTISVTTTFLLVLSFSARNS